MYYHRWKALVLSVVLATLIATPNWATDYRTIALTGDPAAGAAGSYDAFAVPLLDSTGNSAFVASAQGTPGVWVEGSSGLGLVALAGTTDPGTGGGNSFRSLMPCR